MISDWNIGSGVIRRDRLPLLMGILNTTPDSFSDGGQHSTVEAAVQHGLQLVADGADIIDVGGESTRPGSKPVSEDEELQRTIPVIDTTKSEVAKQAIAAGASIVNDISGLSFDPRMLDVCGSSTAGICLMHIQGRPETMQQNPHYVDVVSEVCEFLQHQLQLCERAGISADRICLDPGIGFGKTAGHNLQLMKSVQRFHDLFHRPVLIGHSRKRFLSKLLGRDVEERQAGTVGVSIALAARGVDVLRIHDVRAVRDALLAWAAIADDESNL
jgi:dihydropteroate synthase